MRFLNEWEKHKFAGELLADIMRGLETWPENRLASLRDLNTWGELYTCAVRAVEGLETYLRTAVASEGIEAFANLATATDTALGFSPAWGALNDYMTARIKDALESEEAR